MSDAIDQATEVIEASLEASIRRQTQPRLPATSPFCEECGDEIPAERRQHIPWAVTCVSCQQSIEQRAKHWR